MAWSMGLMGASVPVVAGSFDLISTIVLDSSASSITFSGLDAYASEYQHLQIRYAGTFTTYGEIYMTFNSDSNDANYYNHAMYSTGSGIGAAYAANRSFSYQWVAGVHATIVDIVDAFNTNKFKTSRAIGGNTIAGNGTNMYKSHLWKNTSAISSINIYHVRESLPAFARFSIYGIRSS